MDLEFRQLRILRAVVEAGDPARAAVALGVSPGSLNLQLLRLERLAGVPLFSQREPDLRLSAVGELLLERAETVLPEVDRLLAAARRHTEPGLVPRPVRIGAVSSPVLPSLVRSVGTALPDVGVSLLVEETGERVSELLAGGALELALTRHCPDAGQAPPSAAWSPVAEEPLFAGLPQTHRLCCGDSVAPADLDGERCVLIDPDRQPFSRHVLAVFGRAGWRPDLSFAGCDPAVMALGHGLGAITLTHLPAHGLPGIRYRPLRGDSLTSVLVLAWAPDGPQTEHAGTILDAVTAAHERCRHRLAQEH
jgi:DNA-binding transcriptional LysR family regulator